MAGALKWEELCSGRDFRVSFILLEHSNVKDKYFKVYFFPRISYTANMTYGENISYNVWDTKENTIRCLRYKVKHIA